MGVTTIALAGAVQVTNEATLTISDGLVIERTSSLTDLLVGATGLGGRLDAAFVVFDADVLFGTASSGTIESSRFFRDVDLAGQTQTTFNNNHFGSATNVRAIRDTFGTIDLTNNFWATNDPGAIEGKILHQPDDNRRPLVLFVPLLTIAPEKANPVITWPDPADITIGTALSDVQLNAQANTAGTFVYTPPAGIVLPGGNDQQLSVVFTPSNTLTFNSAVATAEINVLKNDPVITWNDPANIVFGTPLGPDQLNAIADVPGSFVYNPAAGTILDAGIDQPLMVTFTPNDTANFNTVQASVTIDVDKATPVIDWDNPADIVFNTPLSAAQLNATANTAGTFTYTPSAGTILNAGLNQTLNVDFAPTNPNNFHPVSAQVNINVLKADPVITWTDPLPISIGMQLGPTQLNARADVSGTFTYDPPAGTELSAGNNQVLTTLFTPTDTQNFNAVNAEVQIDVALNVPSVSWDPPADIMFGQPLGPDQLNATTDVAGTFVYMPDTGTILDVGLNQTLSAEFVPDDPATFASVPIEVLINVLPATPVITWDNPQDIVFGTPLSGVQLNATANTAGEFSYSPVVDTILPAGAGQTLTVDFTPDDLLRFNPVSANVAINVLKADPVITWNNPDDIFVGTPLGPEQLNAQADVPGTFVYDPVAGTFFSDGGLQQLDVTFTPDDSDNINEAVASVTINVLDDLDYGDAPSSYQVTFAENGPRHLIGSLFLGGSIDREADGQPTSDATGDDIDPEGNDEDGLIMVADLVATPNNETASSFLVSSSQAGKLDAWIDFDGNGRFDHPAEHLGDGTSIDVVGGDNLIQFVIPAGSAAGDTFVRLRLSSTGGLSPVSPALDGEVEDHAVVILEGSSGMTDVTVDAPGNEVLLTAVGGQLTVVDGGEELFRAPLSVVDSINLPASTEDQQITLSFSEGDVIPAGGITIDGGEGQDTILLTGPDSFLDLTDPLIQLTSVERIDLTSADSSTVIIDAAAISELS
ncbi:MAG: GEVED domain-containing protein, partial [Pirellulales bacterium]|nr:GEVED domain-containing protein [Pirellulales bacterium]